MGAHDNLKEELLYESPFDIVRESESPLHDHFHDADPLQQFNGEPEYEYDIEMEGSGETSASNVYGEAGGERLTNKTEPASSDIAYVRFEKKRIPLHRFTKQAWRALVKEARLAGFAYPLLMPVSGYRTVAQQERLFKQALERYKTETAARKMVAKPGSSPHHSGRAIDFHLGIGNDKNNIPAQQKLSVYHWLRDNAQRFGFYPYSVEPWHWEHNPLPGSELPGSEDPNDTYEYDIDFAVKQNEKFAEQLGWRTEAARINAVLLQTTGESNMTLSPEHFARAVAKWQYQRGIQIENCDGVIGPTTWRGLSEFLRTGAPAMSLPSASTAFPSQTTGATPAPPPRASSSSKALTFNPAAPSWVRKVAPKLEAQRGNIPLDFLLGWIYVESSGNNQTKTKYDERGFFQVHPGESAELKLIHSRIDSDEDYSLQAGLALIRYLGKKTVRATSVLGVTSDTELFYCFIKLYHWLPLGMNIIVQLMVNENFRPTDWASFRAFVVSRQDQIKSEMKRLKGKIWDPMRGVRNVDKVLSEGKRLSATLGTLTEKESEDDFEVDMKSHEFSDESIFT